MKTFKLCALSLLLCGACRNTESNTPVSGSSEVIDSSEHSSQGQYNSANVQNGPQAATTSYDTMTPGKATNAQSK